MGAVFFSAVTAGLLGRLIYKLTKRGKAVAPAPGKPSEDAPHEETGENPANKGRLP